MKQKHIGLLGGIFDPPHIGHCIVAQSILEEFNLHEVIFIPAGNPPHKRKFTPFALRYQMTQKAIQNNPHFKITDIEDRLSGKTYTIDVIRALQKESPGVMYLIIGSDQWNEFETWKTPNKLIELCNIIIAPRPDAVITGLKRRRNKIMIAHSPLIDISSTQVRRKIAREESIQYLVLPEVLKFIQKRKLYRKT